MSVCCVHAVRRVSSDNWGDDGGAAVSSDTRIPPVFTIGSLGRQAPFKNQDEKTRSSYIEIVMSCDHNISNS